MNPLLDFLRWNATNILNLWFTMQLQTAVFVLLVLLVERILPVRWNSPRFRYLLWMTVLVKAITPPVFSLPGAEALPGPVVLMAPVTAAAGAAAPDGSVAFSAELLLLIALFAGSLALACVAGWRALKLRRALRDALPFEGAPMGDWPPILISARIPSPLATGIRRPRIYITPAIAEAPRDILLAVLQHERAHLRRQDGVVVVLQTLAQIAYVLNPMMWLANLRIFRYRELICDEEALCQTGTRPQDYGRLLLNFAEARPARLLQTGTCFFETRHGFVQRITELFKAGEHGAMKWKHYALVIAFSLIILPLSWRCGEKKIKYSETFTEYPDSAAASLSSDSVSATIGYPVKARMEYEKQGKLESMSGPRIKGGSEELSKHIVYPEEAKRQGIEGTVIVEVTVEKDGPPASCRVVKSVHPLLDAAALRAVKATTFKAGFRNDKVLVSEVSIPIKFKLK